MKTLEYPLVATSFTEDQVKEIMSTLLKVTLNLCGIQKRLPYPLLYGPLLERGCGLKDIFTLQLAFHLMVILKHQQRDTTTSDLLQEATVWRTYNSTLDQIRTSGTFHSNTTNFSFQKDG